LQSFPWSSFNDDCSFLIIAYQDDKSMTKREGNVHVPVIQTGYTLAMASVLEAEWSLFPEHDSRK
jgi:hypothetical protein